MALTGKRKKKLRHELASQQRSKCCYCARPFGKKGSLAMATIEHIIPLCMGGKNNRKNLAAACRKCNQARGHLVQKALQARERQKATKPNNAVPPGPIIGTDPVSPLIL